MVPAAGSFQVVGQGCRRAGRRERRGHPRRFQAFTPRDAERAVKAREALRKRGIVGREVLESQGRRRGTEARSHEGTEKKGVKGPRGRGNGNKGNEATGRAVL